MAIYRYRLTDPTLARLATLVPGSPTFTDIAPGVFVDITLSNPAYLDDLNDVMAAKGYAYVSTDPTTTAAQDTAARSGAASPFTGTTRTVRLASIADHPTLSGLLTVDGVVTVAGDRILLKSQTAAADRGIWVVSAGAWAYATGWESGAVVPEMLVRVSEGSLAHTAWKLTTTGTIAVGSTALTWVQETSTDTDAIHKSVANEISTITEKVSPGAADLLVIEDSAAGGVKKKVQLSNLPSSGGASASATYVTISAEGSLSAERTLTGTANQVTITDNGANSTVVLSTPQDIHTGATPTFAGDILTDVATPAAPGAASTRIWSEASQGGRSVLRAMDASGVPRNITSDSVLVVRNTSGSSIAKGTLVHVTGSTGQVPNVSLAKADAVTTVADGILAETVANNGFGLMLVVGAIDDLDTSAFSEGDVLYLSGASSGDYTITIPTHPLLQQIVGVIGRAHATQGRVLVDIQGVHGVDSGTIQDTFNIGSNTAGTKNLKFRNGFDLTLAATPTGNRVLTLPDATTTLESQNNKNQALGYAGLDGSSKLTGAQQVYGSSANTATEGNDSRLSDARTPTGAAGGDLQGTYANPSILTARKPDLGLLRSVRLASTANVAAITGLLVIDGVTTVAGDKVLLKNQTAPAENGIYVVAAGAWAFCPDCWATGGVLPEETINVSLGTVNADTAWRVTNSGTITVGTTGITFLQLKHWPWPTAKVVTVDAGGTADFTTIQAALDATTTGVTIMVAPGDYPEKVTFSHSARVIAATGSRPNGGLMAPRIIPALAGGESAVTFGTGDHVLSGFYIDPVIATGVGAYNTINIGGSNSVQLDDCSARLLLAAGSGGPYYTLLSNSNATVEIRDCLFNGPTTLGTGTKKGIYLSGAGSMRIRRTDIQNTTAFAGSIEVNNAGAALYLYHVNSNGTVVVTLASEYFVDSSSNLFRGNLERVTVGDPKFESVTPDGAIWYDTNLRKIRGRQNGISRDVLRGRPNVAEIRPGNATTTLTTSGIVLGTATGTISHPVLSTSTAILGSLNRFRLASSAVAGNSGSVFGSRALAVNTGALPTIGGGFLFFCRFGTATALAQQRAFVGLRGGAASVIGNVNPSTLVDIAGIGYDSAQTTLRFLANDASGTATATDLGANFPVNSTSCFDVEIFLLPNAGAAGTLSYFVRNVDTGNTTSGSVATNLPTVGTFLVPHLWVNNGTTASAAQIDCAVMSIETEY